MIGGLASKIRYYGSLLNEDSQGMATQSHYTFEKMRRLIRPHLGDLRTKAILDLGCGRRYPYTLMLQGLGDRVVGIDTAYIGYRESFIKRYWRELVHNGFTSLGRAVTMDLLNQKNTYHQTLGELCDFPLHEHGVTIKRMAAEDMAFADDTFDLVVSIACFEHIANVPKAVSEVHRVLKPAGLAYIAVHLWSSRSGSHWSPRQIERGQPWAHLRHKRFHLPGYLNQLREGAYITLLSEKLRIVEVDREIDTAAKDLLTPGIRSDLSRYSEEELLTTILTVVARKEDSGTR